MMNHASCFLRFSIAVSFLNAANAVAKESQDIIAIPLSDVFAWKMPGTKDVGTLDAVKKSGVTELPVINDILNALRRPANGEKAGPAFVVKGTGRTALENSRDVFNKAFRKTGEMPAETDLTLVFYSHSYGQFVHLVSAERTDRLVKVKYRFVAHATANNTRHFALIPIGKFIPGTVKVQIEQQSSISKTGEERPSISDTERLISHPFSFEVVK